jgi:tetratricopeptide (TPR) repeat protein
MADKTQQAYAHYQRGVVLEQAGRISEAVEEYRQALQENPRLRDAHIALAKYYRRNALLAKAAEAWAAVVAIQPDYEALSSLASTQIELKRFAEARATLQQLLRLLPDDAFVIYELAFIDYAEERFAEALAQLIELRPIYNDEWQLHHLIGNCQVKLGLYDAAQASFGRAMLLASSDEHIEELQSSVTMIERLREFTAISGHKDWAYAEHGMVYLGSADDDGLLAAPLESKAWTYPEIATTLRRAVRLAQGGVWRCSAVLPVNRSAEPLARALAQALNQPVRQPRQLTPNDIALAVVSAVSDGATLPTIHEYVPCAVVTFALVLSHQPSPGDTLPDIVGLQAGTPILPWEHAMAKAIQAGAAPAELEAILQAATRQIELAWAALPAEATAAAQVEYYTVHHRRLDIPR